MYKLLEMAAAISMAFVLLSISAVDAQAQNPWTLSGNNIFNNNTGNVGVGSGANNPGSLFVVSEASATLPTPIVNNIATFANLDGNPTRVTFDSFGTVGGNLTYRLARGTAASQSATQLGDIFGVVSGFGYGATSYSGAARAQFRLVAAQNWSDTAQGTYISFLTTLNNTVNTVEAMRIDNTGFVGIGTTTPGSILDINGGFLHTTFNSGVTHTIPATNSNGGLTMGSRSSAGRCIGWSDQGRRPRLMTGSQSAVR